MDPERLEACLIEASGAALSTVWGDGLQARLSAAFLRANARDAVTRREIIDTGTVHITEGLSIVGAEQVGAVGLNIRFSDGHDRALFPFAYLRELSEKSTIS